jgi:fatty acid kinase fatty acid binding subunit
MDAPVSVAIVTDSTADIPPRMAGDEGVTIVRLVTTFPDGESFHDGDLTQAEFFERMGRARALPTTSQPPVGDFESVYERLLETFAHVVSIHVSGRLSGTIESARQAAESFGDRVSIVDSRNLSWGLGWQVLIAARAAASGAPAADVVATAERARERARLIVGLDRLDNLARGGRIGAVSAFLGGLLDLKVLFTVDGNGAFEPVTRVRGKKAALRETLEFVKREMHGAKEGMFCVVHAMSEDVAGQLREGVASMFDAKELLVMETGVVIATHTGTGWGIAFIPGESA